MAVFIVTAWAPKCRPGQTEPPAWMAPKAHTVVDRNTHKDAIEAARVEADQYRTDYRYVEIWEADAHTFYGDKN